MLENTDLVNKNISGNDYTKKQYYDFKAEKIWPQIIVVCVACMASITLGASIAWTSPSINIFISNNTAPFQMTLHEVSYLTIISPISLLCTCLIFPKLTEDYGRKRMLALAAVPQVCSWILIALSINKWMLYVSRIFSGIAEGWVYALLPIYLGEISTPKMRGISGSSVTSTLYIGVIIINYVGSETNIHTAAWIMSMIPLSFFIIFIFMPESPYWLIMRGRRNEARIALKWLRGSDNIEIEYSQMIKDVYRQLSEPGTWKDLFRIKSNRRAIYFGLLTRFMQQFGGMTAILSYAQFIFRQAGVELTQSYCAILCSLMSLISNVITSLIVNKIGRRIALISSALGCCIILLVLACSIYITQSTNIFIPNIKLGILLEVLLYTLVFGFGLSCVPVLILSEFFSSSIKSKALAIQNLAYGFYFAASNKLFYFLTASFGLFLPFAMYAFCCLLGAIICYFFFPETKGKRLEEVQQILKSNKLR